MRFIKMSRNIYTIKEDWYNIFVATNWQQRVCEEKSVIKIFYDNDWGWKLVPELASLVLYITGLSGHVKSRRKFPPVLLEIYGLFW